MTTPWLPQLLQVSDSMFPTGAYAHSFGLEGAVQDDLVRDLKSFQTFLEELVVPGLEKLELPAAAAAFATAEKRDIDALCALDQTYGAMKPSRELREAAAKIGRQRLLLLLEISGDPFWREIEGCRGEGKLEAYEPLILGIQGALCRMSLEETLALAYYQGMAPFISAAMKLIRVGQLSCQTVLAGMLSRTRVVVDRACQIGPDQMGWLCPALDIGSARHETTFSRLFIS